LKIRVFFWFVLIRVHSWLRLFPRPENLLDNPQIPVTIRPKTRLEDCMINADELLQPISGEKPCGEDLSYDPAYQTLETLMRGKPETQFSAAEDPDWKQVRELCLELWPRSKDLRLATALTLSSLKTDGLPAFREGLALVKGLLEQQWTAVYPLLDPADNNDPTQRVNIIAGMATPFGTYGDPLRLIERLREAPLADSPQMGRYSLADIMRSEKGEAKPDGTAAPTEAQIAGAFKSTKQENLIALNHAIADSLKLAQDIDAFLTTTVGADHAPDLDLLPKELKEMQKRLAPHLPAGTVVLEPGDAAVAGAQAAAGGAAPAGQGISGDVQTRADVVRMLEKICDYYKREEPSSPVPYILKRAQRLADMDFMQIIDDMTPESVKEIQRITGEKPKEG
jgi:type VI secretion system protein ImpA